MQAFKAMLDYLRLAQVEETDPDMPMSPEERAQALAEIERWTHPGEIALPESSESRTHENTRPESSGPGSHPRFSRTEAKRLDQSRSGTEDETTA